MDVYVTVLTEQSKDALVLALADCGLPFEPLEPGWMASNEGKYGAIFSARIELGEQDAPHTITSRIEKHIMARQVSFLSIVFIEGTEVWTTGGNVNICGLGQPYRSLPQEGQP